MTACVLCGAQRIVRDAAGHRACGICGWRVGDAPDGDLPRPRVDVVYYVRWNERIKIGTSAQPRRRLAAIRHQELLAFERGGRELERRRHDEFAAVREGGEWFTATAELVAHCAGIRGEASPWDSYARWVAEALRGSVS